jgi:hypothetical protein
MYRTFFNDGGARTPCGTEKQRPAAQQKEAQNDIQRKKKSCGPTESEGHQKSGAGPAYRALVLARGMDLGQS